MKQMHRYTYEPKHVNTLEPPDTVGLPQHEDYTTEVRRPFLSRKFKRGLAALAIAGAPVAIFLALNRSSGNTKKKEPVPVAATAPGATAPPLETSTTLSTEVDPPANAEAKRLGLLDLTAIRPGEPVIRMERNGKEFLIPELRNPSEPKAFAESALALWACYLTTGNQACLDSFSSNTEVRASLVDQRDKDFADYMNQPQNINSQASFIDRPEAPAHFTFNADKAYVKLVSGTVQFGIVDNDPGWQRLARSNDSLALPINDLTFYTGYDSRDGIDRPTIVGLKWDSTSTQTPSSVKK